MTALMSVVGASAQSWSRANPRALLKDLRDKNPSAGREELLKLLRERLKEDDGEDFLEAIVEYWFVNTYAVLWPTRPSRSDIDDAKREIKKRATQMVLLEMQVPNGKKLRDCTGSECSAMGGWFKAIAKKIGPTQKVGKRLSEAELRQMWAQA